MTTITIDNPTLEKVIVENNYTSRDVQEKFLIFIEKEFGVNEVDLFDISISDLGKTSQEKLKNIDKLNFINY
ncbi:MAG: hypothetical protein Q9M94_00615 [Candidatus Gracilibacteria bacterium]|nr:hypothetical protein [Candidatus Gracilibacteria bacterium]MDQ7022202.1 hypothetical protein [Candidatus Gracilibacteria bacterium]